MLNPSASYGSSHPALDELTDLYNQACYQVEVFSHANSRGKELLSRHRKEFTPQQEIYFLRWLSCIAGYAGNYSESLVWLTQGLNCYDKDPSNLDPSSLYWAYKNRLLGACGIPGLPLSRLDEMQKDFVRRTREFGQFKRTWGMVEAAIKIQILSTDAAREADLTSWHNYPRDSLSHCAACEAYELLLIAVERNDSDGILNFSRDLLSGRLSCAEQPEFAEALLLNPLLDSDQQELAEKLQAKSYKKVRKNLSGLEALGDHIIYLTRVGRYQAAHNLVKRHISWLKNYQNPKKRFHFLLGLLCFLRHPKIAKRKYISANFELLGITRDPSRGPKWEEVFSVVNEMIEDLARRFDQRNGNDRYAQKVKVVQKYEL
ncbi:MAG: hypothetical protein ACSHYA_15640 [Opitutaceae bacterium]